MTPQQSKALLQISDQILLRDLATLAEVRAEQGRLAALIAAEARLADAETCAVPEAASPDQMRILHHFLAGSQARCAALSAQIETLSAPARLAEAAARRAFGRKRAIEFLAARAARATDQKAARAEERSLTVISRPMSGPAPPAVEAKAYSGSPA